MIIKNKYHNTTYRTRKTEEELYLIEQTAPWDRSAAEKAYIRKIKKALCGIDSCTCSGELGRRE